MSSDSELLSVYARSPSSLIDLPLVSEISLSSVYIYIDTWRLTRARYIYIDLILPTLYLVCVMTCVALNLHIWGVTYIYDLELSLARGSLCRSAAGEDKIEI